MQIVALDIRPIHPEELDISALKVLGTLSLYDRTDPQQVRQRLRGADVVLVNKVRLTAEDIKSARSLKLICVLATGYDGVDTAAAAEAGIPVCNVPGYASHDVAQLAAALLLELANHTGYHNAAIQKGAWTACSDFSWWEKPIVSLYGKTCGIIGCGSIGRASAKIMAALGMRIIGCNPHSYPDFPGTYVSLEELLSASDVISLHCPANKDTVGMINEETLSRMKRGAYLINTARGALVSETDVAAALRSGQLAGYAADVVSTEPISIHNPLLSAPNCVLSGHCGAASLPARQKIIDTTAENILGYIHGAPVHVVNPLISR